jgi:DNA invertase Pin-like site-specific DNA recombinase
MDSEPKEKPTVFAVAVPNSFDQNRSAPNYSDRQAVTDSGRFRTDPDDSGQCGSDLANFQQTPPARSDPHRVTGADGVGSRVDVIYARFSSELQRVESNQDQARRCREHLDRMGIGHAQFRLITDEALSGTPERRPGLDQVKQLVCAGRLGILIVTELSRLSRGDNVKGFLQDIVYQGGRFVSVTEGIDTATKGWKLLTGVSEIHHSQSNEDTAARVRGGQEGRVLDGDGSAGDFPYGYRSEYVDPQAVLDYHGRGPKPRKKVVIDESAALIVREIFRRFAKGNESIGSIVKWLNANHEQIPRIGRARWHHQHVRRILANGKYIGDWTYGQTTTVRDSGGRKKQVAARPDQRVTTKQRPQLRLVDQALWDAAQRQLAKLLEIYEMREGHRKRGPAEHYRLLYAKRPIDGLVYCAACGSRMITASAGGVKRLGCPKHRAGQCTMVARVPYAAAHHRVLELITQLFASDPECLRTAAADMRAVIERMVRQMPDQREVVEAELRRVAGQIENFADAVANGLHSSTITARLHEAEQKRDALRSNLRELQDVTKAHFQMPDDAWIAQELAQVLDRLNEEPAAVAPVIRAMIGKIVAEEIKIPGKRRGYVRLRFRVDEWEAIRQVLSTKLPASVMEMLKNGKDPRDAQGAAHGCDAFEIDLGAPTRLDVLAPQIADMRAAGVKWKDIVARTGLNLGNAYTAYARWQKAKGAAA